MSLMSSIIFSHSCHSRNRAVAGSRLTFHYRSIVPGRCQPGRGQREGAVTGGGSARPAAGAAPDTETPNDLHKVTRTANGERGRGGAADVLSD